MGLAGAYPAFPFVLRCAFDWRIVFSMDDILSIDDAAKAVGVSGATLRRWIARGLLSAEWSTAIGGRIVLLADVSAIRDGLAPGQRLTNRKAAEILGREGE